MNEAMTDLNEAIDELEEQLERVKERAAEVEEIVTDDRSLAKRLEELTTRMTANGYVEQADLIKSIVEGDSESHYHDTERLFPKL